MKNVANKTGIHPPKRIRKMQKCWICQLSSPPILKYHFEQASFVPIEWPLSPPPLPTSAMASSMAFCIDSFTCPDHERSSWGVGNFPLGVMKHGWGNSTVYYGRRIRFRPCFNGPSTSSTPMWPSHGQITIEGWSTMGGWSHLFTFSV